MMLTYSFDWSHNRPIATDTQLVPLKFLTKERYGIKDIVTRQKRIKLLCRALLIPEITRLRTGYDSGCMAATIWLKSC